MSKKFTTPLAQYEVIDGIIYAVYLPDKVNLAQAKEHIRIQTEELVDFEPYLMIVDITEADRSNNKEIRDYLSTPEVNQRSKATAIIANSMIARISANLYLKFAGNSDTPIKFFANKEAALVWLEGFR